MEIVNRKIDHCLSHATSIESSRRGVCFLVSLITMAFKGHSTGKSARMYLMLSFLRYFGKEGKASLHILNSIIFIGFMLRESNNEI